MKIREQKGKRRRFYRSINEINRTFFPKEYERERRAKLSPGELGREDAEKLLEGLAKCLMPKVNAEFKQGK